MVFVMPIIVLLTANDAGEASDAHRGQARRDALLMLVGLAAAAVVVGDVLAEAARGQTVRRDRAEQAACTHSAAMIRKRIEPRRRQGRSSRSSER